MKTKWNKARKKTRYIMAANGILLLVFLALLGAMYLTRDSRLDGLGQREKTARQGQGTAQGAGENGQGTKEFAQTQGQQPDSSDGEPELSVQQHRDEIYCQRRRKGRYLGYRGR